MDHLTGRPVPDAASEDDLTDEQTAPSDSSTLRQPREGLGVGNAPLSDPYQDPDDTDVDALDEPPPRHRGEQAPDERRAVRRFNEAAPREGPAWADRPGGRLAAPAEVAASPGEVDPSDQDVPVEEIRPEDLPEVGELYAQPGAPFDVHGSDRP